MTLAAAALVAVPLYLIARELGHIAAEMAWMRHLGSEDAAEPRLRLVGKEEQT